MLLTHDQYSAHTQHSPTSVHAMVSSLASMHACMPIATTKVYNIVQHARAPRTRHVAASLTSFSCELSTQVMPSVVHRPYS